MFTHLSILECVPTQGNLSLILNTLLQTQLPIAGKLVWIDLLIGFESTSTSVVDARLISSSILPRKLDWLAVERPRFIMNYPNLSTPRAFVKMSVIYRCVLMCCRSTSPARTCSQMR